MKLEIKSKSYGLHWGIGFAEIVADVFSIDSSNIFFDAVIRTSDFKTDIMVDKRAVFAAVVNWCDENDVKAEFTYHQFRNAFNEFTEETHKAILADYKKSMYAGRVVSELFDEIIAIYNLALKEDDAEDKKKVIPLKKSSRTASSGVKRTTKK